MEKEDIYRLVLVSKDTTEVLYEGSEDSCNAKRLELSLRYNSESLKVIRVTEENKQQPKKSYKTEIGKLVEMLTLSFIGWLLKKDDK